MTFGRKLQAAEVVTFQLVELYDGCCHTWATQRLGQRPKFVGLILRPHNEQLVRLDSQPYGRRRIKLLRSIKDHESSSLAARLASDDQRQALGSTAFLGRQPFHQATAAEPTLGEEAVKCRAVT